jgi:hypothetical protein
MDKVQIALRAQDFHESLRVTSVFGPKEVAFEHTLLIGKAACLAMHLRGLLYVDNLSQLKYVAASLGIPALELPAVLRVLEDVAFVSVVKSGDEIKRVDCRIPEFRSGYDDLGERWQQLKPTEVERAGITSLADLYRTPASLADFKSSLGGLSKPDFAILKDVMQSGQLLNIQPVDGQQIVYTPLAVDGNPALYLQWVKRFPAEVQSVMKTLLDHQGLALVDPRVSGAPALTDAIGTGVLMPVQVNGSTGAQRFVFAPKGGLKPEERTILDKARAIVACIRYGQGFAHGRSIKYPRAILDQLRTYKTFRKGHPDLFTQYGLLIEKLIGHPVDEGGGYWNFRVNDTPENIKALDVAIEMMEHGESPTAHIDIEAQKALLTSDAYLSPISTRPKLATDVAASTETKAEMIRQIAKIARGMASHE